MKKKKMIPQYDWVDHERMEQWLKKYFLDPLTSYYDQNQFRIDLYETDHDWIVEASLNEFCSSEILVKVEGTQLMITAQKNGYSTPSQFPKRVRIITLPFLVIHHDVHAAFQNGTLEIFISKLNKGLGKNRYITLP
ncbi:Hsp20/alpha crystallin family protein [Bacillus sp. JJ1764]|uniref:Hsp20/alpha crystallin family protein n=1 Tax=Bacillus sp. JJ1764 TaxID=3122964 RepID=UPI002FFFD3E3